MEKKIEKQRFYISEFREEEAWLAFMQREGWKFICTDGYKYEFEKSEKEDWTYQLDFKKDGIAADDYIQLYSDYGWEYVFKFRKWFYFRKFKIQGTEEDLSIFSDNESKIAMYKRVMNGNVYILLPLYIGMLVYDYLLFFTSIFKGDGFLSGVMLGTAIATMIVICLGFGFFIGQYTRLNKMIKNLENPLK